MQLHNKRAMQVMQAIQKKQSLPTMQACKNSLKGNLSGPKMPKWA